MFVRLRDFKRLIKEAYAGAGLYVARRGNQLLFGGSYWAIATTKESLDKKALAAVIELTGEMPEDGGGFQGDEGSKPIRDQRSTLEFNRRDGAIRRRRREIDSDAPCIKQTPIRSDHADSTGRRRTGGRTGRRIYTGNRSGINEHRLRIRDRGTVYQSPFPKTGILEKRSNNPNRLSVRPRRYERKRSSGLFAEYKDRRIRRNGHGV